MKIECKDLENVLRGQEPDALAALKRHAESCAACARELQLWNEISAAAPLLRKSWESSELWPRIHQALAAESQAAPAPRRRSVEWLWQGFNRQWQTALAVLSLAVVTASGAWMFWHKTPTPGSDDSAKRILTEQAVHAVEANEAAYLKSIDDLAKLAEPKIEHPKSPLMVSYRERLMLIDSAIAECRANIEQNRWNAHLRQELLSIYQDKQRTLQAILREE